VGERVAALVNRGCISDWRASQAAAFTPLRRANGRAVDHTIELRHEELKRRTNAKAVLPSAPLPCRHIVLSSVPSGKINMSRVDGWDARHKARRSAN
jgi:hypothetical protein